MTRLNCTLDEAVALIAQWYAHGSPDDYGNNRSGQRLGQFVFNAVGVGFWPELFYAKHPKNAESIIYFELT